MCHWMGSHFHDSTEYIGVVFSSIFNRVTRMGSHISIQEFEKKENKVTKMGPIFGKI